MPIAWIECPNCHEWSLPIDRRDVEGGFKFPNTVAGYCNNCDHNGGIMPTPSMWNEVCGPVGLQVDI